LHDITCAKIRQIIYNLARVARFRWNFVQIMITWRSMSHELSKSMGQRSRSQR